jgi:hypothetical protein
MRNSAVVSGFKIMKPDKAIETTPRIISAILVPFEDFVNKQKNFYFHLKEL